MGAGRRAPGGLLWQHDETDDHTRTAGSRPSPASPHLSPGPSPSPSPSPSVSPSASTSARCRARTPAQLLQLRTAGEAVRQDHRVRLAAARTAGSSWSSAQATDTS